MLAVFAGLIVVEQPDDLAHHDLRRIVAELLGDGDHPHTRLGEFPDVHFHGEVVAEEAAERVHHDDIKGMIVVACALDHLLRLGAIVVGRRRALLDELRHQLPALTIAKGLNRADDSEW